MREPSDILTIEQLAEYLKISRSTLYKLVGDGKLPGQKVGKRWRFHKAAIDQWLGERANGKEMRARRRTRSATGEARR
ncbi:MAG: helix-turn-helix domain-containing protein [Phycisphaerae bacterium]|nr:helix-turn-helix domain-containing protein [Phycisphaerae bacterium]